MAWIPPNIVAGQFPPASDLEYTWDQIADLTHPHIVDYSAPNGMTIVGSTTSPTLGNSTLQAFYTRAPEANMVEFWFKLTVGSTFSAGNGLYTFSMPVPMIGPQLNTGVSNWLETGTAYYTATLIPISATELIMARDGAGGALTHTGPNGVGWSAGDFLAGQIRYAV